MVNSLFINNKIIIRMKNLFSVVLLFSLVFMSCSKDIDTDITPKENPKSLNLFGEQVEVKDGLLKFENNASFKKVLNELVNAQVIMTKAANDGIVINADYTLSDKDFHSIYDDYIASADEAELYYDKWEDYYEYKAKYSNLFFPEYGDDYSAYLPISDRNLAKLANSEGYIMVGSELVDCKDISSYEDLEKFGLAMPNDKTKDSGDVIHHREGDNLVWVKIHDQGYNGKRLFQFEVCFRDKGFLGIWHNRRASTRLSVTATAGSVSHPGSGEQEGMSSHDYSMAFAIPNLDGNLNLTLRYGPLGNKDLKGSRAFLKVK